ncbi:MAG: serine hydrolase [Kordiimonadaceae bacterium]|nr:serine hydrolase [Kordiimonadaceae bacterium]MBT6037555.1 serine hydrolase [Kordiimonadaceae bacterium]MBT6329789.1 serine hydrolase [Kordiimonadaceae bacterium]MBT7582315.1 serine hydrolase [Kordiimonadaceae bacterium]
MGSSITPKLIFTLCCFLLASIVPVSAQDQLQIDRQMNEALESIIANPLPGISVAVANRDGLVWSGSAGFSNLEDRQAISQNHLFGIGDLSNQFVGVVILQLAAEGFVDLNDTPLSILGDPVANIENADKATLYQLLNHTSGIFSWDKDDIWARHGRGVQMNPKYHWAKDEVLKYITRDSHAATGIAGEGYAYSKSNYTILGLIVEKLTGGLLEDEVRERILVPLNLTNTHYDSYEVPPYNNLVGSYHLATDQFISKVGINAKFEFGEDRLINTSGASLSSEGLAGAIISTPRDLALFAIALKSGKLVDINSLKAIEQNAAHSEILGFTSDIQWLEEEGLVITSFVNMGTVNSGENEINDYLNSYFEKILIPIAKKYAK